MDYLLVFKPSDELLALGNSFTSSLSSHVQVPFEYSAVLTASGLYHRPFDYHLLCLVLKLCVHLF